MSLSRRYELEFFTATILEWKHLLLDTKHKEIIVESLKFLVKQQRIYLCAFCIMSNHLHLLWHVRNPHVLKDVQRDFLKYTAQQIIKDLRNNDSDLLEQFRVNAKDRKYQVWERNPLTVGLYSEPVVLQKLEYIHNNPIKAGLCNDRTVYKYSSAKFYDTGIDDWGFLTNFRL